MKIKVKKTVEEEIEVEIPLFVKNPYCDIFYKITDEAVIKVYDNSIFVNITNDASELINTYKPISEELFNEKFNSAIEKIHDLAGINSLENILQ